MDHGYILNILMDVSANIDYDLFTKKNLVIIWQIIFKNITKYLGEQQIKEIIGYYKLNSIFALPNAKQIIKMLKPYIYNINDIDEYNFTPLMDCLRYGDYQTTNYLLNRFDNNLYQKSYENFNVIDCALFNTDHRIIKLLIDYLIKHKIYLDIDPMNYYIPRKKHNKKVITLIEYFKQINYDKYTNFINVVLLCNIDRIRFMNNILDKYDFKIIEPSVYIKTNKDNCQVLQDSRLNLFKRYVSRMSNNITLNNVLKIISIGCLNHVKELLLMYEKYNFDHDINNLNLRLTTFDGLYHTSMKCDCDNCRLNIKKQFREFLYILRKKIIKSDELIYYKNDFIYDTDDDIIEELFKFGFIPTLRNINTKLINTIKINSIDNSILCILNIMKRYKSEFFPINQIPEEINMFRWYLVILTLKKYIRKNIKNNF